MSAFAVLEMLSNAAADGSSPVSPSGRQPADVECPELERGSQLSQGRKGPGVVGGESLALHPGRDRRRTASPNRVTGLDCGTRPRCLRSTPSEALRRACGARCLRRSMRTNSAKNGMYVGIGRNVETEEPHEVGALEVVVPAVVEVAEPLAFEVQLLDPDGGLGVLRAVVGARRVREEEGVDLARGPACRARAARACSARAAARR